jgi:hypothetical protein
MNPDPAKLNELKRHWPDVETVPEDVRFYIHLPSLKVATPSGTKVVSALLRPWSNGDGYPTRLFFSEKFTNKGNNWNVFSIVGRSWHACSWSGVSEDLPYLEIIASHLRPLQ